MKVLKAKFKLNHITIELAKNPQQKMLVKDGKVIMNSLELFEGDAKVKLRDFKNMELEIQCIDGNLFVNSFNDQFTIGKPTELNKHTFILGIYDDDDEVKQKPKENENSSSKVKFDNKPFKFR